MKYSATAFFRSSSVEWLALIEICIGPGTPSQPATPSQSLTVCSRTAATASTVRVGSGERERNTLHNEKIHLQTIYAIFNGPLAKHNHNIIDNKFVIIMSAQSFVKLQFGEIFSRCE